MKNIFMLSLLFSLLLQVENIPKAFSQDSLKEGGELSEQKESSNVLLEPEELEALKEKAEQGDVRAQSELGRRYFKEEGVPQDYKKAFFWSLKAAEQNDPRAQDLVGEMYFTGLGTSQDDQKALLWFERAAWQGYQMSQETLERLRSLNVGTSSKDLIESYKWGLLVEAKKGNIISDRSHLYTLSSLERQIPFSQVIEIQEQVFQQFQKEQEEIKISIEEEGRGLAKENKMRLPERTYEDKTLLENSQLLYEAARRGDPYAEYLLGHTYLTQLQLQGAVINPEIILELLERAARKGHLEARYTLGNLLAQGDILPRNHNRAITLLKEVAYRGHVGAQHVLANIYLGGPFPDYKRGIFWLEQSAKGGYAEAQEILMNFYFLGRIVPRNYMQAYKWGILADSSEIGQRSENMQLNLNSLEAKIPPSKIMEIQEEAARISRSEYKFKKALEFIGDYQGSSRQLLLPFERRSEDFIACYSI